MRMRPGVAVLLLIAMCALPIAVSARRHSIAHARLDHARRGLAETSLRVERIRELRQREQRVDVARRPEQDLIARVNATLASAGLGERHFGALQLGADQALPGRVGSGDLIYKRQSVRISLKKLLLPELGRFLIEWKRSQPLWSTQRIDLSHPGGRGGRNRTQDERYDASLIVEATYIARRTTIQ